MPRRIIGKDTGIQKRAPGLTLRVTELYKHGLDGLIEPFIKSIGLAKEMLWEKVCIHGL